MPSISLQSKSLNARRVHEINSAKFKENLKARGGWGAIRRLPSKKYQASYLGPDKNRHTSPTTFTTKTQAHLWLDEQRLAVEKGFWHQKQVIPMPQGKFKSSL